MVSWRVCRAHWIEVVIMSGDAIVSFLIMRVRTTIMPGWSLACKVLSGTPS